VDLPKSRLSKNTAFVWVFYLFGRFICLGVSFICRDQKDDTKRRHLALPRLFSDRLISIDRALSILDFNQSLSILDFTSLIFQVNKCIRLVL
jgi:hypothetical protein